MKRPLCSCGNLAKKNGLTVGGKQKYKTKCSPCSSKTQKQGIPGRRGGNRAGRHRYYKIDYCEACNSVALHRCQLDVDHKDGNTNNYEESNLQTLCANCHRLKTYKCKDWENKTHH